MSGSARLGALLLRGLLAGAGLAAGLAGVVSGWTLATWGLLLAGLSLLAAVGLSFAVRPLAAARFGAGLLLASAVTWLWHLDCGYVLRHPSFGLALVAGLVALCALMLPALRGVRWRTVRRWFASLPGAAFAALWLFASSRWFNAHEWATAPDQVVRGLVLPLGLVLGMAALGVAAEQVPEVWLIAAEAWWRRVDGRWASRLVAVFAVASLVMTALVCYRWVGPLPHVEDGIAYLFQAKTLVAGGLTQPAPPVPAAFDARFAWVFANDQGRSYGIFPPGWPGLLALGVVAGAPWLVNPLVGAVTLLLAWRLVRAVAGEATAVATVALLAVSPFFVLQGASFLAHPATLLWVTLTLWAAVRTRQGGGPGWAAVAGLGVGLTGATRYVEGLVLGLAVAGYLAWATARRRVALSCWLAGLLGVLPGLGLTLADNQVKTGSPFVTPVERFYTVEYGRALNRPGFGPDVGFEWDHSLGPGHSLGEGLWNLNFNLFELTRYGFGWAWGSLALALVFLAWGHPTAEDRLLLGFSLLLLAAYVAYWYHCVAFGPRVLHPLLLPLALWSVKGAGVVGRWVGDGRRVAAAVALAVLVAWVAWLPLELRTTYHHHRGRDAGDRRVVALARAAAGGRPCVVVQAMRRDGQAIVPDYGMGFSLNPPGFRGDVLVARELDRDGRSQVAALRRAYPDRVLLLWYKDGPTQRLEPLPEGDGER